VPEPLAPVVETDSGHSSGSYELGTLTTLTATEQQQYIEASKRIQADIDARCRELAAEKEAKIVAPSNRMAESYIRSTAVPLVQNQAEYDRLARWLVDEQMGYHTADAKRGEGKSSTGLRSTDPDPAVREYADRLAKMLVAAQREEAAKQAKSTPLMMQGLDSRPTQRRTDTDSSALMMLAEVASKQKQYPSQDVRRR